MKLKLALCVSVCCFGVIAADLNCSPLPEQDHISVTYSDPKNKSEVVDVSKPIPVNTVAEYRCSVPALADDIEDDVRMTCNQSGNWSDLQTYTDFKCSLFGNNVAVSEDTCGIADIRTHFEPWHALIFGKNASSQKFLFKCGASLIKPVQQGRSPGNLILTGRSCLADASGNVTKPEDLRVAMGTVSVHENLQEAQVIYKELQHFSVDKLGVQDGDTGLALLKLKEPVRPTVYMHPICLDLDATPNVTGKYGHLVGLSDLRKLCNNVMYLEFMCAAYAESVCPDYVNNPVIKRKLKLVHCRKTVQQPHEQCLSQDKGHGSVNVPEQPPVHDVCPQDFGGGIVFPQDLYNKGVVKVQSHVIVGVFTQKLKNCTENITMTSVSGSLDWIKLQAQNMLRSS